MTTKLSLVKNVSPKPLSDAQMSLLARGPNFADVWLYSLKGKYMTAVEQLALNYPKVAAKFRAETS